MKLKDFLNEKVDPKRIINQIAKDELDIPTLKSRGKDELDFYEINVDDVKRALTLAFEAGKKFNREKN